MVYPTVSGMFTVRAPASTAAREIWHRKSNSVRLPSSALNATSSTKVLARRTAFTASLRICDFDMRSLCSRWMGLVAMKVSIRGRLAGSTALAARSISSCTAVRLDVEHWQWFSNPPWIKSGFRLCEGAL